MRGAFKRPTFTLYIAHICLGELSGILVQHQTIPNVSPHISTRPLLATYAISHPDGTSHRKSARWENIVPTGQFEA